MSPDGMRPPSDFLGNMQPSTRETLFTLSKQDSFSRGEHIFQHGDPGRHVYLIESGRAKIYKLSEAGREVILWFCFPGEVFGLAEAPRGVGREVYAQACSELQLRVISRSDFTHFLEVHPTTSMQVIDLLSCRMRVLSDMLLNLVTDDVTSRLVKLLIRLSARYGVRKGEIIDVELPLTHQEMADMIGTSRQTVTTALNELRRQGVLSARKHHLQIRCEQLVGSLGTAATADKEVL